MLLLFIYLSDQLVQTKKKKKLSFKRKVGTLNYFLCHNILFFPEKKKIKPRQANVSSVGELCPGKRRFDMCPYDTLVNIPGIIIYP